MTLVWNTSGEHLKGSERLLMLAIADHAHDDGYAFPGIERLAIKTGISERQVMRLVQKLEEGGWLIVERNKNRVNKYHIVIDKLKQSVSDKMSPSLSGDNMTPEDLSVGDNSSRDTHVTQQVTSMSPEPSVNHHKESVSSGDNLSPELAEVVQAYEQSFGLIDKTSRDELNDYLNDFGVDGIKSAIGKAKQRGKDWRYAKGIFRNWANEGRGAQLPTNGKSAEQVTSELKKLASSYGRSRFKIAEPELKEAGLYEIANSIGWTNLCTMRENDIKFAVYRVMQ